MARIDEQERIASALADTMARRLFTIGLQLSGVLKLTTGTEVRQRIEAAIEEADSAISELRRAVFNPGRRPARIRRAPGNRPRRAPWCRAGHRGRRANEPGSRSAG